MNNNYLLWLLVLLSMLIAIAALIVSVCVSKQGATGHRGRKGSTGSAGTNGIGSTGPTGLGGSATGPQRLSIISITTGGAPTNLLNSDSGSLILVNGNGSTIAIANLPTVGAQVGEYFYFNLFQNGLDLFTIDSGAGNTIHYSGFTVPGANQQLESMQTSVFDTNTLVDQTFGIVLISTSPNIWRVFISGPTLLD